VTFITVFYYRVPGNFRKTLSVNAYAYSKINWYMLYIITLLLLSYISSALIKDMPWNYIKHIQYKYNVHFYSVYPRIKIQIRRYIINCSGLDPPQPLHSSGKFSIKFIRLWIQVLIVFLAFASQE